jgi:hypothetical protein
MIISHRYRFIFIKTYKTAGTSLEVYLSQHCGPDDVLTPIFPHVEPHQPRNYQSRWNPLRDLLSGRTSLRPLFNAWRKRERFYNHIPATQARLRIPRRIWDSYFKFSVERNPWDKTLSHYHMLNHRSGGSLTLDSYLQGGDYSLNYPQYLDERGNLLVDRVLKYETLTEELSEVFGRLGVPFNGDLGVHAKSEYRTDRRNYREVFTPEQRSIVERLFAKEIALHGYTF